MNALNQRMRSDLKAGAGHIMPGVANALAARVVEQAGHRMMMVSRASAEHRMSSRYSRCSGGGD